MTTNEKVDGIYDGCEGYYDQDAVKLQIEIWDLLHDHEGELKAVLDDEGKPCIILTVRGYTLVL